MKDWMRRFGVLTILGALLCGALVAGCSSDGEEDAADGPGGTGKAKTEGGGDAETE